MRVQRVRVQRVRVQRVACEFSRASSVRASSASCELSACEFSACQFSLPKLNSHEQRPRYASPKVCNLLARFPWRPWPSAPLAHARPRGPQNGPRTLGSPNDRPKRPKAASSCPRNLQDVPREPQYPPQEGPNNPKSLRFRSCLNDISVIAFSSSRRSKASQESRNTAPRRPKKQPSAPQDGPRGRQKATRGPQDGPREPEDGPKRRPRGEKRTEIQSLPPKEASRRPQEAQKKPRNAPRGPKTMPKKLQNCLSEALGGASHEMPPNVHEASDPPRRHSGGCADSN